MQPREDKREHGLLQRRCIQHKRKKFALLHLCFHHVNDLIKFLHAPHNQSNVFIGYPALCRFDRFGDALFKNRIIVVITIHENFSHLEVKGLNGVGSFINRENLAVAGILLNGIILAVAVPAVYLHRLCSDQPRGIGDTRFNDRCENFNNSHRLFHLLSG